MSPSANIRRGQSADLSSILGLLEGAGLPISDLKSIAQLNVWVLEVKDSLAGVVALERCGSEGLLRSLAVAPGYRNNGFASRLVERLENDARAQGVTQLVLLTETAQAFFASRGYEVIDRLSASEGLKQSAQFRSLCPLSAKCMSKALAKQSDLV